ncbi:PQQ-dependent sugar dehydrogenase [Lunatibacter salilacus]|uniref:PQQ-dependent sugar dehydrogenase n=1 Tax=Lunatibacter salilacus TaxID=2483804 RepID=UPI00131C04CB|nr:PQQ-dependent sugar dehydrogenase [Lunatibacter salilacus]
MKSFCNLCALIPIFLASLSSGCTQGTENPEPIIPTEISITDAFPGLTFTRPVDVQHAGDERFFVVEQRGVISVVSGDLQNPEKGVFLDIESQVRDQGNEEGLLGLAFHPDFENNGYFFVNYTASSPNRTVISRFQVSASNANQADSGSGLVLLEIEQPYGNHNGGQVVFGPDGYLYTGMGDGGSGGDPQNNSQNLTNLLGAILRIDVDNPSNGMNYSIPPDNPFVNNKEGYREEIFAYGLRNPWRFSFDVENGNLWTGDVGQNRLEEINIIENGGNYGWRVMEGTQCFNPAVDCDRSGLTLPIWEYGRSAGDVSITGGFVYRGESIPQIQGQYIYGDFVSGRIWSLEVTDMDDPINTELIQVPFGLSSFGVDSNNELLLCGFDGKIHRLIIN